MRVATVSEMKRGRVPSRGEPREGTKVRAVYDLFMTHKGTPVSYSRAHRPEIIDRLTDNWGLDIRRVGKGRYLLAGEWFGREYVDYVAARFHALEHAPSPPDFARSQ
jgi:hypothetical protein